MGRPKKEVSKAEQDFNSIPEDLKELIYSFAGFCEQVVNNPSSTVLTEDQKGLVKYLIRRIALKL